LNKHYYSKATRGELSSRLETGGWGREGEASTKSFLGTGGERKGGRKDRKPGPLKGK